MDFEHKQTLSYIASCALPTPWATFKLHGFIESRTQNEHLALTLGEVSGDLPLLTRVHSECLTGDALFSMRCDCGAQLEDALKMIAAQGRGMLLYLRQEGRGIGLLNKLRAYQLQDQGHDTVEANEKLGFSADQRDYDVCKSMLAHFGVCNLRLMTNNPRKIEALERLEIQVTERIPLVTGCGIFNRQYLATKAGKLGHLIPAAHLKSS